VNGKSSGFLTAYNVHSKESTDIVSEDASQPLISRDGKRVAYITFPAPQRTELWVSDIDGRYKKRIAAGENLGTGLFFVLGVGIQSLTSSCPRWPRGSGQIQTCVDEQRFPLVSGPGFVWADFSPDKARTHSGRAGNHLFTISSNSLSPKRSTTERRNHQRPEKLPQFDRWPCH
jgi:hypothetical protein